MRTIPLAVIGMLALAAPAAAQNAQISDRECAQVIEHVARNDVNFQPGVDVRGRPVAPANTAGQLQVAVPQNFTIDLSVNLKRYGVPVNSPLYEPTVGVGKVTVEDGGRRVLYNGQRLGDSEQQAIAESCKQRQSQPQRR